MWFVLRRSPDAMPATAAYRSDAAVTPPAMLVWPRGMRRPVEAGILETEGEAGPDHYKVRGRVGRHHHITPSFLAHPVLPGAAPLGGKPQP